MLDTRKTAESLTAGQGCSVGLHEITSPEQFAEYYKREGLSTLEDKIEAIKKVTGITAMWHCHGATTEDILIGLEDSVLHGSWRDFD
jgi:hypothetical protein